MIPKEFLEARSMSKAYTYAMTIPLKTLVLRLTLISFL